MFQCNSSTNVADLTDGASNTVMIGETKYIGTPESFIPTDAWWGWAAGIRAANTSDLASLFNISATCDPINFPQETYSELDIRRDLAVSQGGDHGGQQRVYGSWHSGGGSFLMADGSVHFLNENMDVEAYRRLGKRADGLPVEF
jgi:prepilin-type processing-associated H-X9-DG protein